jgi:hypothetical protein
LSLIKYASSYNEKHEMHIRNITITITKTTTKRKKERKKASI